MSIIHKKARDLRHQQTDAETCLWYYLRDRRFFNCKFRRQHPIGPYIADFFCLEQKLIIEVDGGQHAEQLEYDIKRTTYLNEQGFRLLRFWNNEVLQETESVLETILNTLESNPHPESLAIPTSPNGRGE